MRLELREVGGRSRLMPVFLCIGEVLPKLRTRIYIDGYNLYYGCLRNTPYKWLDVLALFEKHILPSVLYRLTPDAVPAKMELHHACAVKYFTAQILERAAKSDDSVSSQAHYHNALKKHSNNRLSFVIGNYSIYQANQHIISADDPNRWPRDCDKVQVWKLEEKQSDVNLALQIYDDALQGDIDQVVLVTNDTDLVPALAMLKKQCPNIVRGLVIPTRKTGANNDIERTANQSLTDLAHWVRKSISSDELNASQLPDIVTGARRASIKPHSWYPKPHHLKKMLELARPVLKTDGKIMKWAKEPAKWLNEQRPIDLIETDEGAESVFEYIKEYVKSQPKGNTAE